MPVFQDVTEPKQQLHRVNSIEVYQPIDFQSKVVHWLTVGDLHYALVNSHRYSDGSSREEFFNKHLKSVSLEKQDEELNGSDAAVNNRWRKIVLSSVSGHNFECSFPRIKAAEGLELSLESLNLSFVMSQFNGTCFYRNDGWWTYEFCVGKHVKQYHLNPVTLEQEDIFYLGFPVEKNATEGFEKALYHVTSVSTNEVDDNVIRIHYDNGSLCVLTGSPRNVTIDFICPFSTVTDTENSEFISSIREIGTCSYHLTLASSALCSEPLLRNHPHDEIEVTCKVVNETVLPDVRVTTLAGYKTAAWF
ncbi:uncharacterized protein Gasu_10270 [Galdieria sulphuraria]|uniref:MRH domain-containing protein n=1 Tax=Galdieria sulphuraria TaxID=130081 RepID=M2W752_GALSU|nr:uncharacterized protein Gasu_10270 [Galdieria sulphuraria]EME31641.1 hypothetical protein Gasu_10270 [Galdieria sulphuraria]|eukprot:XP_005708161.1 hypothetical protein Gasu_10270 [Galdieria sulphuraria]